MNRICQMQQDGRAFLAEDHYSVGSAFFTKRPEGERDLSFEFYLALTEKYLTPGLEPQLASEPKTGIKPPNYALSRR